MKKFIVIVILLCIVTAFGAVLYPLPSVGDIDTWGTDLNNYLQKGQGWTDIRSFLPSGFVTDGSVDYSTEVQAGITAMEAGATLFVSGKYLIKEIKIAQSIEIIGADKQSGFVAVEYDAGGSNRQSENIFFTETADAVETVKLIGLDLDGSANFNGSTGHREPLVKLQTVENVEIIDCHVHNHSGSDAGLGTETSLHFDLPAISIWYSTYVIIRDCTFKDNYTEQIFVHGAISTFTNVLIDNNKWLSGILGASPIDAVRCTGTISNNHMINFQASGINALGCKGMTIKSNRFIDGTSSYAIDLVEGGAYEGNDIVIEDNYIEECAFGIIGWGDDIIIRNNILNGIKDQLAGIQCSGFPRTNASDFYTAAEISAGLVPVERHYTGLIIDGNIIKNIFKDDAGNQTAAINAGNGAVDFLYKAVKITNNVAYTTDGTREMETGVLLTNVSDVKVERNSFYDFTKYGVFMQARTGTTIDMGLLEVANNYFDNANAVDDVIFYEPRSGGGTIIVRDNYITNAPAATMYKLRATRSTRIIFIDNIGAEQSDFDFIEGITSPDITYHNLSPFVAASPTTGLWVKGDKAWDSTPTSASQPGWITVFNLTTDLNGGEPSGETSMVVTSSTNALDGDIIGVVQDDGTTHWTTIASGQGTTTLVLTAQLTDDAADENAVYIIRWEALAVIQ